LAAAALLFSKDGLGTGDVAARGAQRGGVAQLLRGLLHAQAEMGLLQALTSALRPATSFWRSSAAFISSFS
jgi:hypothetical protein